MTDFEIPVAANDNKRAETARDRVVAEKTSEEARRVAKAARRLIRRQSIGDPRADNDNQSWPLAEQLRRDGNDVLLHVAERYRTIYNAAKFEPRLVGTMPDDFWSTEQYHSINSKTGRLKRDGEKRGKTAALTPVDDGTYKADAVTEDRWSELVANGPVTFARRPSTPVMRKWHGDDALIAAIDAKPMLYRLQGALGPLVDPFEDAVIGDMTLTEIGRGMNAGVRGESAAGKVLVMLGLETIQKEFSLIDREAPFGRTANTPQVPG